MWLSRYNELFLLFFIFAPIDIGAVDIGSDTAVTRFNTQQTLSNGDRIAGFAWLAAGFALRSAAVTGTFDCVFPVLGTVDLAFGTLSLNEDLYLNNITTLAHWGTISGNFHVLSLPAKFTCFPAESSSSLVGGVALSCSPVILLNQTSHGTSINHVNWSPDNSYVVSGATLTGTPAGGMFVDTVPALVPGANVTADQGVPAHTPGPYDAPCIAAIWHPFYSWVTSGIGFSPTINEAFTYNFTAPTGPITQLGSVDIPGGSGGVFSIRWHPVGTFIALGESPNANSNPPAGTNRTLEIYAVSSAGVYGAIAATQDLTSKNLVNALDFNTTGSALVTGTDTGGGLATLRVYTFSLTGPTLTTNVLVALGAQVNAVAFNQNPSMNNNLIAVGVNFIAAAPVNNHGLLIYQLNQGAATMTQVASAKTSVNVTAVDWSQTSSCLLVGSAAGVDVFNYNQSTNTLTLQYTLATSGSVTSARFSPNGQYIVVGDTSGNLSLYGPVPSVVGFSNLFLNFNCNSTFSDPAIQFSGTNVINGNRYVLSFAPTYTLQIMPNSSLLIKDITIQGLSAGQLIVDASSTVSFQDVFIELDGDYTFSSGRFEILKNLEIFGSGHNFIYTSTQTSLIRSLDPGATTTLVSGNNVCSPGFTGALIIDQGVTFQYNSTSATNLIQLEGNNAQWIFNSATLTLGNSLQLTKGRLVIDGKSFLTGAGSLIIGDGANVSNDLTMEIRPAANLLVSGTMIYNNL